MPLLRRVPAAAVSAVVLATNLVTASVTASAQPADPPRSACVASGAELRYLVLFDTGVGQPAAAQEIAGACGTLTAYYPEIAVAVASAADPTFAARLGTDRAFSAQRMTRSQRDPDSQRDYDETAFAQTVTTEPAAVSTVDRTAEQWDMTMIGADRARRISLGSKEVVVGVLDSGVDPDHPDLTGALDPALSAGCLSGQPDQSRQAWVPTASPHGTHVAGTIAAADDGHGTTGIAPGVRIASVKVVDDEGRIFPEYAVCGLMWASANKMTITNNSYFVDPWLMTCDRDNERVVYEAVRRAVDHASRRGVLTVAAATNEGADLADPSGQVTASPDESTPERRTLDRGCKVLPAGLRGVVAVSAVGPDELKAGYSSYGLGVIDVAAPGGETRQDSEPSEVQQSDSCVLSTVPGGYDEFCGTSMATPHASGVAALLASENPDSSPQQLTRMLTEQADSLPCPPDYDLDGTGAQDAYCTGYRPYNGFYGHGLVDALAAVTGP